MNTAEKTLLVRFKAPNHGVQHVIATSVEIHADHLIFTDGHGELAALFLMEWVEGWTVLP
jgi:hypothetical protein